MQAMASAIAQADAVAQQLLAEEERAAAQAVARSAPKQGKKRCAKKRRQQRRKAKDQQLLQAYVRPSDALSTPQVQHSITCCRCYEAQTVVCHFAFVLCADDLCFKA